MLYAVTYIFNDLLPEMIDFPQKEHSVTDIRVFYRAAEKLLMERAIVLL